MTLDLRKGVRAFSRNPWCYRFLSWLVGGICGALLCLLLVAGLVLVPVPIVLVLIALPLSLIYGFAWGWLLMRRPAHRAGIKLEESVLKGSPWWQWHLGLGLGIPLFWTVFLFSLGVYSEFLGPTSGVTLPTPLPPPTPGMETGPVPLGFFVSVFAVITVVGALLGRGTVALWAWITDLRRKVNEPPLMREGVW